MTIQIISYQNSCVGNLFLGRNSSSRSRHGKRPGSLRDEVHVSFWLQADIQPPEIEVRCTPSSGHSAWVKSKPRRAAAAMALPTQSRSKASASHRSPRLKRASTISPVTCTGTTKMPARRRSRCRRWRSLSGMGTGPVTLPAPARKGPPDRAPRRSGRPAPSDPGHDPTRPAPPGPPAGDRPTAPAPRPARHVEARR